MSKTSRANSATSAISLAAITAGAVAAAVVIMSIGSIVTIISIGSSINPGMQAATNFIDINAKTQNMAALLVQVHTTNNHAGKNTGNFYRVKKHNSQKEKSFYIDAILREDTHTLTPANDEQKQQQPKLSIKGNHVFATLHLDEVQPQLEAV